LQKDPKTLQLLYIRSPVTNQLVPLSAFAQWTTVPVAPLSISHQGQFPAVTLSFNLAPGVALGQATQAIQRAEQELKMPAGLQASFQGNAQAFQQSLATVPLLILAALLAVYIILGVLYESFIHPLTILSGLPSAAVGALIMLWIASTVGAIGAPLTLYAFVGIMMLVGIVKKNAIMMIDFALNRQRSADVSAERAIVEAAQIRFRPIMMTTMAAIMGTLPIAIGFGAGSEARRPLGIAVAGGLLVSQVLTLYITPVIYTYLDRVAQRMSFRKRVPAVRGAPAE
jgi:multidrug efflux pump subunit AcrB